MTRIMFARILADRAVGIVPGSYVVGESRESGKVHRLTGLAETVGSADVLVVRDVPKAREPDEPFTTEATLLRASQPLGRGDADETLKAWEGSQFDRDAWRNAALQVVNSAIRAARLAMRDPYLIELTDADLLGTTFGHLSPDQAFAGGEGKSFAEGPSASRKPSKADILRRGEAVGLALSGRSVMLEAEELLLFAGREANHGRLESASAALDAGHRLLRREVEGDAIIGALPAGLSVDVVTLDAAAVLETIAGLQDTLDRWRTGPADVLDDLDRLEAAAERPATGSSARAPHPSPAEGPR